MSWEGWASLAGYSTRVAVVCLYLVPFEQAVSSTWTLGSPIFDVVGYVGFPALCPVTPDYRWGRGQSISTRSISSVSSSSGTWFGGHFSWSREIKVGFLTAIFCIANDITANMATQKEQRPPSIIYGPRAPAPLTLTFGQLLDHQAETRPDAPAIISHVQGCTVSYSQLRDRSIKLARAMRGAGIGRGSLVGIISGTRCEYLEVRNPFLPDLFELGGRQY